MSLKRATFLGQTFVMLEHEGQDDGRFFMLAENGSYAAYVPGIGVVGGKLDPLLVQSFAHRIREMEDSP